MDGYKPCLVKYRMQHHSFPTRYFQSMRDVNEGYLKLKLFSKFSKALKFIMLVLYGLCNIRTSS